MAREYARQGWDVALSARRAAPMEALAAKIRAMGQRAEVFTADLFDPATPKRLYDDVVARMGQVDGLVNNAGYGHGGSYLDSPWEDHARFLQLMLTAPSEMSRYASADMAARGFGRIVNVASLAGHLPGTRGHTLYAAVKSYLIRFSESLNAELTESGIHATAVCPGFTYTEFHDVNGTRAELNKLPEWMMQSAEDVAREALEANARNKAVYITGGVNKSIALLGRALPGDMMRKMIAKQSSKFRRDSA